MQSQYGSPSQAAAVAQDYMGDDTRVVKMDGSSISCGESIVYNLLRIVDHLLYAIPHLLGVLLICTSPTKQRLGDRVAHVMVIRRF
jgi:uncharacterized RDD family membrane protein YckC